MAWASCLLPRSLECENSPWCRDLGRYPRPRGAGTPQGRRPRLFFPELSCSCQPTKPTSKGVRLQFQPHKTLSLPRCGLWSLHAAWALSHLLPK